MQYIYVVNADHKTIYNIYVANADHKTVRIAFFFFQPHISIFLGNLFTDLRLFFLSKT